MILTFPRTRAKYPWLLPWLGRVAIAFLIFASLAFLTLPYLVLRDVADETFLPYGEGWILPVERFIGFGETWNERLQVLHGGGFGVFEWICFVFYVSFFFVPLVLLPLAALISIPPFLRLVRIYLLMLYVGAVFFLVMPTEPPWMTLDVERILHLRKELPVNVDNNAIAAFPSLHVGIPAAFALWAQRERWRWLWPILLVQTIGVGFTIIYFGEHYVVDVLAGILLAYGMVRLTVARS